MFWLSLSKRDLLPLNMCYREFPVRLDFAMAIDKSQGQMYVRVGIETWVIVSYFIE